MDNWYDRKQYLEEMRLRLMVTWVNGDRKNGLELTEDDCKFIEILINKEISERPIKGGLECPECGNTIRGYLDEDDLPVVFDYCPWCGQKIDNSQ